jgi:hypothetical protein
MNENAERVVVTSKTFSSQSNELLGVIVAAVTKMTRAKTVKLPNPFHHIFSRQLVFLSTTSYYWKAFSARDGFKPDWTRMPKKTAKSVFVVKGFSSSSKSRVFLACTETGAVCVIKTIRRGSVETEKSVHDAMQKKLQKELDCWKKVYPEFKDVRILTLNNIPSLMLPHFDSPKDRKEVAVLEAIEATLRRDYDKNQLVHRDIAWRNIGIRRSGDKVEAVVFDMESVEEKVDSESDWVAKAMTELKKRA